MTDFPLNTPVMITPEQVIDERLGFSLIGLVGLAVTDGWTVERFREAVDAAAQNRTDELHRQREQIDRLRTAAYSVLSRPCRQDAL